MVLGSSGILVFCGLGLGVSVEEEPKVEYTQVATTSESPQLLRRVGLSVFRD